MKPVVFAALLILSSGVLVWTPAQAVPPGCTEIGTQERDILAGTSGPDKICGLGGRDYSHGNAGNDTVLGGGDDDTLVGGPGRDRLLGGPGRDRLFAIDSRTNDLVKGGAGFDRCYIDKGDKVRSCEEIRRVNTAPDDMAAILALQVAFLGVVKLGEQYQEDAITGPTGATGPPGPPGTDRPPFPACPSPVDATPQPCPDA